MTPGINIFHEFSVIGGDKFITSVVDTAEIFSPVTTTPAINLSRVSMTLLNNDHR
jgi:hypothetical protein